MSLRLQRLRSLRPLTRRVRSGWERVSPFPLPRYIEGTPRITPRGPADPFFPPTASTIASAATSEDASTFVAGVLDKLTPSAEHKRDRFFYGWGWGKYGHHWRHADILTVLCASSYLTRPSHYMEIGVRRGRSAAIVAAMWPDCALYGFDIWTSGYAGDDNPGPDFVRNELQAVGHSGDVTLVSGDSKATVPTFLRQHPDLYFDLIAIDGDKSLQTAAADLANSLPRLRVGGIVILDDIAAFPALARIWEKIIRGDSRYVSWEFTESVFGVGAAVRVAGGRGPIDRVRFS